jgi:uncharacterized protein (TIGR03000 family)
VFYGFGLGLGLGYGYPWYYGDYYPGYYGAADYGYSPAVTYSPGYSEYPDVLSASSYSQPSVVTVPDIYGPPSDNAVYLEVRVPPDAELWFEGQKCTQTGPIRYFESPPLTLGQNYVYHVRVRWIENGREVERTQEVTVSAGKRLSIDFTKLKFERLPEPRPLG